MSVCTMFEFDYKLSAFQVGLKCKLCFVIIMM